MVFRRLHLGTVAYGMDSMDEVQSHVFSAYTQVKELCPSVQKFQKLVRGQNNQFVIVV